MKLGYRYILTAEGWGSEDITINGGDWTTAINDERTIWQRYEIDEDSLALTIVKDGILLATVTPLQGSRSGDNITTWIFVPSKVNITGRELLSVIKKIREINQSGTSNISKSVFESSEVLMADFPERKHAVQIASSSKKGYAYRMQSMDYSLQDLLGALFQPDYAQYEYVFFYEKQPMNISGIDNLSNKKLINLITVLPPSPQTIKKYFGEGDIKVYLENSLEFNGPITLPQKAKIELSVKKQDCEPIQVSGSAETCEEEIYISNSGRSNQWRKVVPTHKIRIIDSHTGATLRGNIDVKNADYDRRSNTIPEKAYNELDVEIKSMGYASKRDTIDLSKDTIIIRMEKTKSPKTYRYKKDGQNLEITIDGVINDIHNPIEGYEAVNYNLKYIGATNKDKFYHKWWFFLCVGLLLGVSLCAGVYELFASDQGEGQEQTVSKTQSQSSAQKGANQDNNGSGSDSDDNSSLSNQENDQFSKENAIKYLNGDEWKKDEMEQYPDLQGLFDELNNYKFNEVIARKQTLEKSDHFKKLLGDIEMYKEANISGKYDNALTPTITVTNYRKKLKGKWEKWKSSQAEAGQGESSPINTEVFRGSV